MQTKLDHNDKAKGKKALHFRQHAFDSILKCSNSYPESDQRFICTQRVCLGKQQVPDAAEELNQKEYYSPHSRQLGSVWLTPWFYGASFSLRYFLFSYLMQLWAPEWFQESFLLNS